jgi:hypothetical protein
VELAGASKEGAFKAVRGQKSTEVVEGAEFFVGEGREDFRVGGGGAGDLVFEGFVGEEGGKQEGDQGAQEQEVPVAADAAKGRRGSDDLHGIAGPGLGEWDGDGCGGASVCAGDDGRWLWRPDHARSGEGLFDVVEVVVGRSAGGLGRRDDDDGFAVGTLALAALGAVGGMQDVPAPAGKVDRHGLLLME